jgi:hypothetical protein
MLSTEGTAARISASRNRELSRWLHSLIGHALVPPRESAINAGLRALGVLAEAGRDEYEAVGLTRHWFAEDWLTDLPPCDGDDRGSIWSDAPSTLPPI